LVDTLFTNRLGGVSQAPYSGNNLALHVGDDPGAVGKNRSQLEGLIGPTQYMNQTHGNTVAVVDGKSTHEPNADALVTAESGIVLAVLVADCIPLLLWDEVEHVVAAVHVGRKGLLNGVAAKTISVMNSMGAEKIQALMGPSICGKCYEVSREIHDEVTSMYPEARSTTSAGTWALDLSEALADELGKYGIKISRSLTCTVENSHFFSYRRDGVTGRQAGLIWQ
jgi:hypothetical protein